MGLVEEANMYFERGLHVNDESCMTSSAAGASLVDDMHEARKLTKHCEDGISQIHLYSEAVARADKAMKLKGGGKES